jgi:SAM-dependent methyltransferase
MSWQRRLYERQYRRGGARHWDTGITPPEVVEVVEGEHPPSGRALDLGCGTGTNVRYLAEHGFEVVGVDFSRLAIERARAKLEGVDRARVLEGDVTELWELGVRGPFDLVLDIGCFHGLPRRRRDAYVEAVERVARPGALFLMFAWGRRGPSGLFTGVSRSEMDRRFGNGFDLFRIDPGTQPKGAAWYHLRRRGLVDA